MPTLQQLQKALIIAEKIEALKAQLDAIVGASPKASTSVSAGEAPAPKKRGPKKGSKRVLSPEARAKIAEAQKRRWAKKKK